jgi:hypothetical protein
MRLAPMILLSTLVPSLTQAQERWQRLPGAASSYRVDLHTLALVDGVLQARVQTPDLGNVVLVQELEIRCRTQEARTVARLSYDLDTGRRVARPNLRKRTHSGSVIHGGARGMRFSPDCAPWLANATSLERRRTLRQGGPPCGAACT